MHTMILYTCIFMCISACIIHCVLHSTVPLTLLLLYNFIIVALAVTLFSPSILFFFLSSYSSPSSLLSSHILASSLPELPELPPQPPPQPVRPPMVRIGWARELLQHIYNTHTHTSSTVHVAIVLWVGGCMYMYTVQSCISIQP